MLGNGRMTIPREQLAVYKCTSCGNEVFRTVNAVTFYYDKLNPRGKGMAPQAATLYQCAGCKGYLKPKQDGGYEVIHPNEADEE